MSAKPKRKCFGNLFFGRKPYKGKIASAIREFPNLDVSKDGKPHLNVGANQYIIQAIEPNIGSMALVFG